MADKNKSIQQIDEEIKALKQKKRELQQAKRKAEKERLEKAQKELGKKVMDILKISEEEIPYFVEYLSKKKQGYTDYIQHKIDQNMEKNEDI